MRLFVRKSKAERARQGTRRGLPLNREGVKFFEEYFGHKFPFPKYDLVLIPEFAYGGMEHAGATFLREEGVLFPSDPTAADVAARAESMLHEAAHQWFGDLVTMRWFDDLWLKEGFATFMAYKAFERVMPRLRRVEGLPPAHEAARLPDRRDEGHDAHLAGDCEPLGGEVGLRQHRLPQGARRCSGRPSSTSARASSGDAVRLFVKEHAYAQRRPGRTSSAPSSAPRAASSTTWADAWVKRRGMPDVRVRWAANRRGRISRLERRAARRARRGRRRGRCA